MTEIQPYGLSRKGRLYWLWKLNHEKECKSWAQSQSHISSLHSFCWFQLSVLFQSLRTSFSAAPVSPSPDLLDNLCGSRAATSTPRFTIMYLPTQGASDWLHYHGPFMHKTVFTFFSCNIIHMQKNKLLKYTIQCFLICSYSYATIITNNFRTLDHLEKKPFIN